MILSLLLAACTAGPVADTGDTGADRLLFTFPVLECDAIGTPMMGVDDDPEDHEGTRLDPFAGEYSQDTSWWWEQGPVEGLPGGCP